MTKQMTELILIVAVAKNRVIGNKGELPWEKDAELKKADFKRFRELTLYSPVIMGRKTYESIIARNRKPLADRLNIVLTRNEDFRAEKGVEICNSLEEAVKRAGYAQSAYIIGGQQIYELTINRAHKLEITEIHKSYEGDAFFPEIDKKFWNETNRIDNGGYSFVSYVRAGYRKLLSRT